MKKYPIDGKRLKHLRSSRDRVATQKEFAYLIGLSVRKLRDLENGDAMVTIDVLERLAKELKIPPDQLSRDNVGRLVSSKVPEPSTREPEFHPRFTEYSADVVKDEVDICHHAAHCDEIVSYIRTPLTTETSGYAEELLALLQTITWGRPIGADERNGLSELEWRRRVRQLLVLLRGNDVWVYLTDNVKYLPESFEVQPRESRKMHSQMILAFGPPGEDGETTISIPIDHGQPWVFDWNEWRAK